MSNAVLVALMVGLVAVYRAVLSPLKRTPTCRFMPTCSEYATEALRTRGVVIGSALTAWRILRCQPFSKGGFDPVPPAGRHACASCEEHV
jgi:putative membrane protein insertion efficiency factor